MAYLMSQEIYNRQNRVIHKACSALGLPYMDNKDTWISFFNEAAGRRVKGMSDMTLNERKEVIDRFNLKRYFAGKRKLYNPYINRFQSGWKKGDAEGIPKHIARPVSVHPGKQPLVSKVHAILTELKLPWSYADAIAQSRFGASIVEFLNMGELNKVLQMLVIHQGRQRRKK